MICLRQRDCEVVVELLLQQIGAQFDPVVGYYPHLVPEVPDLLLGHPAEDLLGVKVFKQARSDLEDPPEILLRQSDHLPHVEPDLRKALSHLVGHLKQSK